MIYGLANSQYFSDTHNPHHQNINVTKHLHTHKKKNLTSNSDLYNVRYPTGSHSHILSAWKLCKDRCLYFITYIIHFITSIGALPLLRTGEKN